MPSPNPEVFASSIATMDIPAPQFTSLKLLHQIRKDHKTLLRIYKIAEDCFDPLEPRESLLKVAGECRKVCQELEVEGFTLHQARILINHLKQHGVLDDLRTAAMLKQTKILMPVLQATADYAVQRVKDNDEHDTIDRRVVSLTMINKQLNDTLMRDQPKEVVVEHRKAVQFSTFSPEELIEIEKEKEKELPKGEVQESATQSSGAERPAVDQAPAVAEPSPSV